MRRAGCLNYGRPVSICYIIEVLFLLSLVIHYNLVNLNFKGPVNNFELGGGGGVELSGVYGLQVNCTYFI